MGFFKDFKKYLDSDYPGKGIHPLRARRAIRAKRFGKPNALNIAGDISYSINNISQVLNLSK